MVHAKKGMKTRTLSGAEMHEFLVFWRYFIKIEG
jgi:hypothetical protein